MTNRSSEYRVRHPYGKCINFNTFDLSHTALDEARETSERVSGAWVFRGTRVLVSALFENLGDDVPVHQFIEWCPDVTLAQARTVLEHAGGSAIT